MIEYGVVCGIGVLCVAWWWREMRGTAWLYTLYVAAILMGLYWVMFGV